MLSTWLNIETWLDKNAPQIKASLNNGIEQKDIEHLENVIGIKLPLDFLEFYKIHNGQDSSSEGLINAEELLSFERIIDEWSIWKDLLDKKTFQENGSSFTSDPDKGIKNDWWNPLWIPITYDGSGNHFCLDLDPTDEGKYGQVIRMWHDDSIRSLEANSFTEWINAYAIKLQNGDYIYSEDWGGIISKDNI